MSRKILLMLSAAFLTASSMFYSCKKDSTTTPVLVPLFTVVNDALDGYKVNISNKSTNATSYTWNFGDGSALGTQSDTAFSYEYTKKGIFTITLTAKNTSGSQTLSKSITISGAYFAQVLNGNSATGKVWNVTVSNGVLMFSPDLSQEWYGWNAQNNFPYDIQTVCNNNYIFKSNGSFAFQTNGFTIRPVQQGVLFTDVYSYSPKGWADTASWIDGDGKDCSTWGNNTNVTYKIGTASIYPQCNQRIVLNGKGGHIGFMDGGTTLVTDEPIDSTWYEVRHFDDGGALPDTLVLWTTWGSDNLAIGQPRGTQIGQITLVSYKNASQIPAGY